MADLVDIVIPANGQTAAEALGLKVHRSITTGARVRQISREEAEIVVECLRDWGVSARIVEDAPRDQRTLEHRAATSA
jgi:hydrogenase maturation factor